MRKSHALLPIVAALAGVSGAAQAAIIDDFNSPNGTLLGAPTWTNESGFGEVIGGQVRSAGAAQIPVLQTLIGVSATNIEFDISRGTFPGTQYLAAVLNYADLGSNYFFKLQDLNGKGAFNSYFFAFGNNQGGPLSGTFVEFTDTFTTGHLKAEVSGRTMTVTLTPTGEAARILTHIFSTDTGGTGVGIGLFGDSRIDNVGVGGAVASSAPEPACWAMMVGGFGAISTAMRRRRRVAVRFA